MTALLLYICGGVWAQGTPAPVNGTPQGPETSAPEPASASDAASGVSFEEQAQMLTSVYPVTLDRMGQVAQNSYNWRGIRDASLACEIGFTPQAIVIRGKILDDQPFVQPIAYPAKPDWWKVTYAADGITLSFEDPTSATNRLRLILNFSSAGLAPKVQVLEAPMITTAGVLTSADLHVRSLLPEDVPENLPDPERPLAGFRFECAIPTTGLAEPKFFSGPLRMTVRLHDLDGEVETYLRMEDVLEKRE
jgi:hypothetical protein